MSQQGGRPGRPEDDWWGQLYDDSTEDTGPTAAPDSLDDRFASAKRTVTGRPVTGAPSGPGTWDGTADAGGGTGGPPRRDDPPGRPLPGQAALPAQRTPEPQNPPAPPGRTGQEQAPAAPPAGRYADDGLASAPPPEPPDPAAAAAPPAERIAPEQAPLSPPEPQDRPTHFPSPPAPLPATTPHPPQPTAPAPAPAAAPAPAPPTTPHPPQPSPATPPQASAPPTAPHPPEPTTPAPAPAPTPAQALASVPPPTLASLPLLSAVAPPPSALDYVGSGPPTYDPEPTALPGADPDGLAELVADTVLDGARYGACTLRAVSLRGDSARYRGEPRRDSLLTARFGTGEQALVLVAMATGVRGTPGAHLAAAEACRWIGRAVGRSHHRLAEDIRAARRGDLKSGLHRLTDRSLGRLRASAAEQGVDPEEYAASLRCLLLPADPDCRTRVFFGVGDGGLFRLRNGEWQDIEPRPAPHDTGGAPVVGFGSRPAGAPAETPEGDRLTMDLGIPTPPSPYEPAPEPPREPFRFRASVARPGDALVMCTAGLADPLRGEAALPAYLARRWSGHTPPGLAAFLADAQVRVKGYADDRTAAAVWEA
ncbi:hypothetical protein GCM10010260_19600 [Streptomyces filipinensis]|uniref:PPM-type phosphatase domain-containing protein n=1 Tax=Streptomyces filipinensis TaxID=66887 RepID=A0A918M9B7_9ACTN|nr:protein phosphatase 2C domain-containing protein [Streptomyces filipinensis]GGU86555.1 hypothetical protein GCM10010260_19600 [Streptomyces filipinensis]